MTHPAAIPARMDIARDVPVAMDDGCVLRADVFRPPDQREPGPVILSLGPYGKSIPFRQAWFRERWERLVAEHPEVMDGSSCTHMNWETVDPEQWVPRGYVVVRVDSRGAGRSGGVLSMLSQREVLDYAQAVAWAGAQPWSNGRVGLCGVSYYAINQWLVAGRTPPHLAAILPWEGASDHYRDMTHHGGILSNRFFDGWYPRQVLPAQHGHGHKGEPSPWTEDGTATGPETLSPEILADHRDDYLGAIRGHPFDDAWHRERSPDLARITVPLLSAGNWGGLGLHARGNIEGFLGAGSEQKWLELHTGRHEVGFYTPAGLALQRRFFDRYLRGDPNDWEDQPPVHLAIRRADRTTYPRGEQGWPLPRTRWTPWHLDALAAQPALTAHDRPPQETGSTAFDGRCDGATFTSSPLEAPLEITGPLSCRLFVSSSDTDADCFLTLRAFAPDGSEVTFPGANDSGAPLSQGWLRLSHRALDPDRSLPWRPWHPHLAQESARPGEVYEVAVEMWPTCVELPARYRLALTITGRDFHRPGGDGPHHGSGPFRHDEPTDRPPGVLDRVLRVHTGGRTPSSLLLPVIP